MILRHCKPRTERADLDGTIFPYDCSMRLARITSSCTTGIVSSKSDIQHLHDSCTQHKKCCRILKHVLKPYDSRSHNQNVRMTSCIRSLPDVSSTHYKSRMCSRQQKSYHLNWPKPMLKIFKVPLGPEFWYSIFLHFRK